MNFKLISANPLSPDCSKKNFKIELPNKCPLCTTAYGESPVASYYVSDNFEEYLYSVFFCPHCRRCFLIKFSVMPSTLAEPSGCIIHSIFPNFSHTTDFPEQIKQLSPQFLKIYHQAELAENAGLTEICGMGYRKALEFLIKDYAIHKNPDFCEEIKSKPLAQCINQYILSSSITTLAKRSAWIGNDETHYVRKHEDFDFTDMKTFIQAAQYFISMDLVVEKAASISPR